jgi:hypothetical protein
LRALGRYLAIRSPEWIPFLRTVVLIGLFLAALSLAVVIATKMAEKPRATRPAASEPMIKPDGRRCLCEY